MRTEKGIRRELSNYEWSKNDAEKHKSAYSDYHHSADEYIEQLEYAIRALRFVLEEPKMVECPNCKAREELFWVGDMMVTECDCGYVYSGEFGWNKPDGT